MRRARPYAGLAALSVLLGAACDELMPVPDEPEPLGPRVGPHQIFRDASAKLAVTAPEGWVQGEDHGAVVWTRKTERGLTTIAIKSAPRKGETAAPRTPETVVPATRTAIQNLPGAQMRSEAPYAKVGFEGATDFDVLFTPRGKDGVRYHRRHVVLVGKERVFHVFATGRPGALGLTADAFSAVIDSLQEEV